MTKEQLQQLKDMTVAERVMKYLPELNAENITKQQYDYIISLKNESSPNVVEQSNLDDSNSGEVVETVLKEFGGREVKTSQKERLLHLLLDGEWHATPEIQEVVYGKDHLGVARIASRVNDLNNDGHNIESKKFKDSIWMYKLVKKERL